MSYQVTPSDPVVQFDHANMERNVAAKLKTAGITTQAQLNAVIANITTTTCPGMSNAACQALQALLSLIQVSP